MVQRPSSPVAVRPRAIGRFRRVVLWVVFAEVVAASVAIGLRLRGVAWPLPLNTLAELLAAAGTFLVVREWCRQCDLAPEPAVGERSWPARLRDWLTGVRPNRPVRARRNDPPAPLPFHGFGRGMLAATLFWLNPALLLVGAAWPPSNAWPMTFFVFAVLGALRERWFLTGALVAAGAMLDGPFLLVAPMFVLWPLFTNAPRATTRAVVGFLVTVALVASPRLVGGGVLWVVGVAFAPLIARPRWFGRRPLATGWVTAPIALQLVLWPLILPAGRAWWAVASLVALGAMLVWSARRMSAQWLGCQIAFAVAAALFLCPLLFDGSIDGFDATWREVTGGIALAAGNLAAILDRLFHVRPADALGTIDLPALAIRHVVTVTQLLAAIYGLVLGIASATAARHTNRFDARLLVVLILPGMMFFALVAPTHARCLAWAACLSATWIAARKCA